MNEAVPARTGMCPREAAALLRSGLLLLVAWSMLWTLHAHAQAVRTITFEEAILLAREQSTDLQRARNDVRLRGVLTTQERMDFFPDLQISSDGTRTFGRSFSQEEGQIIDETSDFFGAEASASLDLFNGFERFASLQRAEREEGASLLRLERTRQDVFFRVFEGFTALLQNRELARVRAQELETQRELLEQVGALVEVGRRPTSDRFQQRAAVAEARAARAEAERLAELSQTQLIQILQLDPTGRYTFEAPELERRAADEATADDLERYDLGRLLEQAFARRADLEALDADLAAARQAVRVARAGYWPSLSLSAAYGSDWSSTARLPVAGTGTDPRVITVTPDEGPPATFAVPGSGSDPQFERPPFFEQLDQRRGGAVRLSLFVPLFDRLQTRTLVEEARVQALEARYDLQDQRQQVALQVRQALLDYRSARAQLRANQERLQAARQARQAAERRYELGAATFVELTQAVTGFVAAQSALVRARYDVLLTHRLIDYYTGSFDPENPFAL